MDTLVKLVQLGPTGAGLAFSILSYWLLLSEQKQRGERPRMLGAIRFFMSISMITFVLGLFATLVTLFADKIVQANARTIGTALTPGTVSARFSSWEAQPDTQSVSFSVRTENLDLARFIPEGERNAVRLIVAVRPHSADPNMGGRYPLAFGPYDFDTLAPQVPDIKSVAPQLFAAGCVDFVLFRISKADADAKPLARPFEPASYGASVKVLNAAYDGQKCP